MALYAGGPALDRAQHHPQRRDVDGPAARLDAAQSGCGARGAANQSVVCVLPYHRARERGGTDRQSRSAAHPGPISGGRQGAPRLRYAVLHRGRVAARPQRSEEHTSELQSPCNLVCRLLLEKKKKNKINTNVIKTQKKKPNQLKT